MIDSKTGVDVELAPPQEQVFAPKSELTNYHKKDNRIDLTPTNDGNEIDITKIKPSWCYLISLTIILGFNSMNMGNALAAAGNTMPALRYQMGWQTEEIM